MRSCSAVMSRTSASRSVARQLGVAGQRVELGAQGGQRRAQLVAGVGGEAARRLQRARGLGGGRVEPAEHRVQRAGELAHLVGRGLVVVERGREVLGAVDARRAAAQARERPYRERGQEPGGERGQHERRQPEHEHEPADVVDALLDRRERARDLQPRGAAEVVRDQRERAPRRAGDVDGLEAVRLRHGDPLVGDVARLVDDLVAVGDLRERVAAAQQRVGAGVAVAVGVAPGRRRIEAERSRRSASTWLRPSRSTAATSSDAGEQAADADRRDRGQRDPRAQAAGQPHGRSAQPTPRTVWRMPRLAAGSSLRRR